MAPPRDSKGHILLKGFGERFYEAIISRGKERNVKFVNFFGRLDPEEIVAKRCRRIGHFYKFLDEFFLFMRLFVRNKKGSER